MNHEVPIFRLQDAWRECERNVYYLCQALALLNPIMPMTGEIYADLNDDQVRVLDQFILRFTKLQDAMGNHLFPAILTYLQEPYEDRSMLDKLNRLEKLGYLEKAQTWQDIRNTRNKFAHDYPDDEEKNAALINVASEVAGQLCLILMAIQTKLQRDQPSLILGKLLSLNCA